VTGCERGCPVRSCPVRSRLFTLSAALTATCIVAACNSDGRTLRPPGPNQNASISTLGAVTTTTFPTRFDTQPGKQATTLPVNGGTDTLDPFATDDIPAATDAPNASGDISTGSGATDAGASSDVGGQAAGLRITAPWSDGGAIPKDDTCDGANLPPAISWSPAPTGTVEVAITMTDDQAPGFVHWVMAGIDPAVVALKSAQVPDGAVQATNGSGKIGFTGPCPPAGPPHTYRLTVHYLGQGTELDNGAPGKDLLDAVNLSTIASATVTGTYQRA
jgi:Raf kinase inhibitor-like YbhB/YbcL family protein